MLANLSVWYSQLSQLKLLSVLELFGLQIFESCIDTANRSGIHSRTDLKSNKMVDLSNTYVLTPLITMLLPT